MLKLTFKCAHCSGSGLVGEDKLKGMQRKIIAALRGHHLNGIEEKALVEKVYGGRKPFHAVLSLQLVIRKLNRRMTTRKIVVTTNRYTSQRRYQLLRTTDGDHHAGGLDLVRGRSVLRRDLRNDSAGVAGAGEAERH